jgi:hypothetical protein
MTGLFWMVAPSGDGAYDWAMERIGRAEILILQNAEQALSLGGHKSRSLRQFSGLGERVRNSLRTPLGCCAD